MPLDDASGDPARMQAPAQSRPVPSGAREGAVSGRPDAYTLSTQLAVAFAVLVGAMLLIASMAAWNLRSIQQAAERLAIEEWPRMMALQELATHAHGHGAAMARLLTAKRAQRESIYPALDAESAAMDRLTNELLSRVSEPGALALVRDIDAARHRYREVFADVGVWIESGEPARAAAVFAADGQPALDRLIGMADRLAQAQRDAVEADQRRSAALVKDAERQLLALAVVALFAAAGLAWRIGRGVARPMGRLAATARRLAAGDLLARFETEDDRGPREVARVGQAMDAMADAIGERNARIEAIAFSDPVTGLPNRAGVLRQAAGFDAPPDTVLLLDVARLAAVNDVLGPAAGDALLDEVGRRLQAFARHSSGCVAHLGAGTFALLWRLGPEPADRQVESCRAALLVGLSASVPYGDVSIDAQFRSGWSRATSGASDAADLGRAIREAEEALGDAKRMRVDVRRFERTDPEQRRRQLVLLGSLSAAAASGDLQMWLQPKVSVCREGVPRCLGFEALVRWRHPQWGMVSPAEFVPFAEAAGMVGLITRCMIEQALSFLTRVRHIAPDLHVSVNVGTADLLDGELAGWLRERARAVGAPLDRLTLEITEGRLMEDADRALPAMITLRDAGVRWSIDDFGTGYSSLAYLQRLPVDELKVDRSFVDHVDTSPARMTLLRGIVQLGHGLGLQVTAEGVERQEEWSELARAGCDLAQGWLIARPMPPDAALAWVAGREVRPASRPDVVVEPGH
jgi:predicted signal transduction protein with EAL and GGDEF domain